MLYQSKQIMKIKAPPKLSETSGAFENTPVLFLRKWKGISFCVLLLKLEANIAKIVLFRRGDNSLKSAILICSQFHLSRRGPWSKSK